MKGSSKLQTTEFTADQIVAGIASAIAEREFEVVVALLRMLAVRDPRRAQDVLDTFELAGTIRED